jgi:hypothetical protein
MNAERRYSALMPFTGSERTVPTGALVAAMAIIESLHGRNPSERDLAERGLGGSPGETIAEIEAVAEITFAVKQWGEETLTEAFGQIIATVMSLIEPGTGMADNLHTIVPAVLVRLHRMRMSEVPDESLPTVAGLLTAAFFQQDLYTWRMSLGPIGPGESLVWCYTAWLLVDFADEAVFGVPGRFAEVLTDVLALNEAETQLRDEGDPPYDGFP